jgi:hypothetical protein
VPAEAQADETVSELEGRGCTHIEVECAVCGRITRRSLFLMRTRGEITPETTFEAIVGRIRCAKCKASPRPGSARPVQGDVASLDKARKVRKDSR